MSNEQYLNTSSGASRKMGERNNAGIILGVAVLATILFLSGYWIGGKQIVATGSSVQQLVQSDVAGESFGASSGSEGFLSSSASVERNSAVLSSATASTSSSGASSSGTFPSGTSISVQSALVPGLLRLVLDVRIASRMNDTVRMSLLVTKIHEEVSRQKSVVLSERWDALALCLAHLCGDAEFLRFIIVLATEADRQGNSDGSLILSLLAADQYWSTDNTVRFAEAVTLTDASVQRRNQTTLSSSWAVVVACASKCSSRMEVLFSFFDAVAS